MVYWIFNLIFSFYLQIIVIGQVNKVTYIDLISEGTIDEKIAQSLRGKIDIASEVMGEEIKQWVIDPIKKRKES